jgi:3-deoxy-manno-octulosonate cytidylyltransferase (CMP-KDO synthetase)
MSAPVRVAAIIPARMAARRLPGKPLLPIRGLPMVEHVRRRALLCGRFAEIVVATCDAEIAEAVERSGGQCLMTSPGHPGATDRVAEASGRVDCTHVVNLQGDEILVLPEDLAALVAAIEAEPEVPAWNAVARLDRADLDDAAVVKCAVSRSGRILYCTRNFAALGPALGADCEPLRRIVGVLGYRRDVLARFVALPRTPLELAEAVDQSRLLEHDLTLRSVAFRGSYPGINEPREAAAVERILEEDPIQRPILEEVLRMSAVASR